MNWPRRVSGVSRGEGERRLRELTWRRHLRFSHSLHVWRLVPTLLSGGLGLFGICGGAAIGVMSAFNLLAMVNDRELWSFVWDEKPTHIFVFVFGSLLLFSWGACLLYASRCFWICRWKHGMVFFVAGLAFLVLTGSLLRWLE